MQGRTNLFTAVVLGLALALGLVGLLGGTPAVRAASYTVTRFDDPMPDGCSPTDCSLREAVIAANASPNADTIILPAGTYVLTLGGFDAAAAVGDLDITGPVTLIGQGPEQTIIDASAINDRVIEAHPGADVTISGMSIINGSVSTTNGGGVACYQAALTLENAVVRLNSAGSRDGGGLYARECTVTLSATQVVSNVANNGGGIYGRESTLALAHSTVAHNDAARSGGGIYGRESTLALAHSTVAHNDAARPGGGVYGLGTAASLSYSTLFGNTARAGGGLFIWGTGASVTVANSLVAENEADRGGGGLVVSDDALWLTIENSTFSGNRANGYGGGVSTRVPTTITHATITNNWAGTEGDDLSGVGGLFAYQSGALVRLEHTILAGNVDRKNATDRDCRRWGAATVTSQGYNLVEAVGNCTFTSAGDISGQDPLLGPLQDNGGATWTHALLDGSPARDAGDPNFAPPPLYDQRGPTFPRLAHGRVDIGAFEVRPQVYLPLVVRNR